MSKDKNVEAFKENGKLKAFMCGVGKAIKESKVVKTLKENKGEAKIMIDAAGAVTSFAVAGCFLGSSPVGLSICCASGVALAYDAMVRTQSNLEKGIIGTTKDVVNKLIAKGRE